MSSATVTSKGQITIPKYIRTQLGIRTGDRIAFAIDDAGGVRFVPMTTTLADLKGSIPKPRKPVSLADMQASIKAGATGQ
ncbi:MAG: AbrB/MazE/SpoVT family DNA-binding domain-containing protein [Pseudomonadota bacterium]